MIPRRPLGAAGPEIPVLGLGVSGPLGAGVTTQRQVTALVRAAHEGGARFFDTAPFYGDAERRLGAALQGLPRASYVLATKAGEREPDGRIRKDFTAAGVRAALLKSLAALRTDHVDLFFL
ncbi:MAG: aldo/keto reductase, partial [Hyphomonadaceae bacterium]